MRITISTIAISTVLYWSVLACHPANGEADLELRGQALEPRESVQIAIAWTGELNHEQIHQIANYAEKNSSGEVHSAKVKVKKTSDEGPTELLIALTGHHLDGKHLEQALRNQFPVLQQAKITTSTGASLEEEVPAVYSEATDPQEAREEIVEQLREQGVDGKIDVDVSDEQDGRRRVEIRVEKQELD